MQKTKKWRFFTPARVLSIGFAVTILIGAILLSLPISSQTGESLRFLDALEEATSAVCVTGLIVVDTGTYFNHFGQIVLISLIQIGGLGFMTLATFITIMTGRKIGLKERLLLQEAFNVSTLEGLIRLARNVVLITMGIELFFAIILAIRFSFQMPLGRAIYYGVFHSISAFCNAGFDLFGGFKSISDYVGDPTVSICISLLIILGGLGFTVFADVPRLFRGERTLLHTKLVLIASAFLLVVGTIGTYLFEKNNPGTIGNFSEGTKWLASYFNSATARTAGYASINYETMTQGGLLWTIILMFIGASPGSTGGGIKTVTSFVIMLYIINVISNRDNTVIFGRQIARQTIYKALVISVMAVLLIVFSTMILTVTENVDFLRLLFETTSAFATVGLSTNLTPTLSDTGKVLIILLMYIGRLGPLTLAVALAARQPDKANLKYPEGNLYVG
ncbi:TrkH family potassium uptake protein [Tumebacillus flagellatus]|uniref:ATP synthase subunit J n=1 Tax=Tumebacillus flagellatus TaxID=1157490 RepID=A0A074LTF8_9BACL|nr:TrkH family potassium uptake protein [Tumebacillus flagellatus]KEO84344.1 ATP synthase subunit J [Tumebacillus flagellatus]